MTGCIPTSLFVSEVLVVLSSCVFVVMALLTAVVSVTNITFTDKTSSSSQELHCHLPHRFTVGDQYDIPSSSNCTIHKNPAISEFTSLLISTLRADLIKKGEIKAAQYLPISIDKFVNGLDKALKENAKIQYSIQNIPTHYLFYMVANNNSYPFPSFSLTGNKTIDLPFNLKMPTFFFDIESLKNQLVNVSRPITIVLPLNLSALYFDKDFDLINNFPKIEENSTFSYLVYGWNDDFVLKKTKFSNSMKYTGGFIVRQFLSNQNSSKIGHSISYFYGNLSSYEESRICPNPEDPNNFPIVRESDFYLANSSQLRCINSKKCNLDSIYYLLESEDDHLLPDITQYEDHVDVGFIEVGKNLKREKVYLKFPFFEEIINSFYMVSKNQKDVCSFNLIPFSILAAAFSRSKSSDHSAYGIDSHISWALSEYNFTRHAEFINDRPKPLFDL